MRPHRREAEKPAPFDPPLLRDWIARLDSRPWSRIMDGTKTRKSPQNLLICAQKQSENGQDRQFVFFSSGRAKNTVDGGPVALQVACPG